MLLGMNFEETFLYAADDTSNGGGDTSDTGQPTPDTETEPDQNTGNSGNDDKRDAGTFTQAQVDNIVADRAKRAADAAVAKALKALGVNNLDIAAEQLKAHREREEAEMSEAEKLQKQIDTLTAEKEAAIQQANQLAAQRIADRRDAVVLQAARAAGTVDESTVLTLLTSGDALNDAISEDGNIDEEKIKSAVETLRSEKSYLFSKQAPNMQSNNNGQPTQLDKKKLEEIARNHKRHIRGR